jgi:M6 family metalloprotease-like protein
MKKQVISLLLLLFAGIMSVQAVPAYPGVCKVTQPDGTTLSIRLHGDEYLSYTTTEDGYSLVKNDKGVYVYAQLRNGVLVPTSMKAHDAAARTSREVSFLSGVQKHLMPRMTVEREQEKSVESQRRLKARQQAHARSNYYDYSNFRGLIILVEYNDRSFESSDYPSIINDMVNKPNYEGYNPSSEYGRYTGSVRDYFYDNSMGRFSPQFDVVGPVKVNRSQYFVEGGKYVETLMSEAVRAADPLVDFSKYDRDDDGTVDMIYFIFAGLGSNIGYNDSRLLWPHASAFQWTRKDDVYLGRYACSTELYGSEQEHIYDGIGTICHEFSHVLGLPDLYDTDYDESGGESCHPAEWSLMASGSYQNNCRTPVGYTLYERYAVGFAVPQTIKEEGSYTLQSVATSNTGYRLDSPVDKEYFLLENRQTSDKWDAYLPGSGMLVYRVDSTDARAWRGNYLNNDPSHNRFAVLRAMGDADKPLGRACDPFPGTGRVTELNNETEPANLKTWEGDENKFGLNNISEANGVISFNVYDANILKAISIPEKKRVIVGSQIKLTPTCKPLSAKYEARWTSDNEAVAKVSENGVVEGISEGEAKITLIADDSLKAECMVVVENHTLVENTAALKLVNDEAEVALKLSDAQVVYINKTDVYLRDGSGAAILENTDGKLAVGDVLNGALLGQKKTQAGLTRLSLVADRDIYEDVLFAGNSKVEPRIVSLSALTDRDLCDYILIPSVQMQITSYEGLSGMFVVSGDTYVRLYNPFGVKNVKVPTNYAGKLYDVTGILVTQQSGDQLVKELALLKSPEQADPAKIDCDVVDTVGTTTIFTLDGRKVENLSKPGLYVVRQGSEVRKVLVK